MKKITHHDSVDQRTTPYVIKVKVIPKAKFEKIKKETGLDGKFAYKIYVTAPPEDGKANDSVIKLLSKMLGIAKSCLTIIHGQTSSHKTILIN